MSTLSDWTLYFLIILFLSGLIHHFYKKLPQTKISDGNIIMAIGIFSLYALQKMPFTTQVLTQLIALELLIIWLYLIGNYIKQYLGGYFTKICKSKLSQFEIGTWVTGSSLLAILFFHTFPSLSFVVWISATLAWITWLVYMAMSSYNLWLIISNKLKLHIGIILLPTVSTKSIVLLTYSLFTTTVSLLAYQMLIVLSYLFYLIGLFIIVKHRLIYPHRNLILSWNNTNSIIHGALSFSGLVSIYTHAFNDIDIFSTWVLATSFFILNEGISFIKCIYRLKLAGFFRGILVYHGSQWTRVFTFGMYYAFNLTLLESHLVTNLFIKQIVHHGQYGVLAILLFELFNYFYNQFDFER
jgi:hypothetical protein